MKRAKIIYFSHGGGPMPLLGDKSHRKMVEFMEKLPEKIEKPDAVIVVSAHWEEHSPTVLENPAPDLYYDYYGFPEEAYNIEYPCKNDLNLVRNIKNVFKEKNFPVTADTKRGYDHGLFVPMKMIYPEADVPMTQISLIKELNPSEHINLGRTLRPLLNENVLLIGSGFSFHNMSQFSWSDETEEDSKNNSFQDWLIDTCTGSYTEEERERSLTDWEKAPSAKYCHPREEHLMPLHVCIGASRKPAELIFDDYIIGKRSVAFMW